MQSIDNKVFWADDLRAFATISVILVHVSAPLLFEYGTISNLDWWTGNIVDSTFRFCVPIFLMLTGALILPKTYKLGDFFKKRISRILLPFIFWSFIYILYNLILKWQNGDHLNAVELSKYIFTQLQNGASFHLWYVYMIIGIYLFIPIISKWIVNSTKNEITYFIVIWAIVILINLPFLVRFKPNINLSYFSGFLGYPILGYLLTIKFTGKKIKWLSLLLFLIGTLITIFGTYLLTKNNGKFNGGFYSFLSPNIIIASIGVFLFFRDSNFKYVWIRNLTEFISKYSYGIYLAHIFVLILLSNFGITRSFINPIIGIPLTTILCLTISTIITYTINKIPYGAYISG